MNHAVILVTFFIYSVYIAFSNHIYFTDLLPLIFLFAIGNRFFIKKLLFLNLFVFIVFITTIFQNKELAFLILLRSNIIFITLLLLFSNKDYFGLVYGLQRLGISKKFTLMVFFFIKSVSYLLEELNKINTSLKARGFEPKTNLFTYKIYANSVALLLIKTFHKSKTIQNTIKIRNFNGEIYHLVDEKIELFNLIFLIFVLLSTILNIGKII